VAPPVGDSLGRVNKLELLVALRSWGAPGIDVVVNCSVCSRDLFINQMGLTCIRAVKMAAREADEPLEMNFVRKHSREQRGRSFRAISLGRRPRGCSPNAPAVSYSSNVKLAVGRTALEEGRQISRRCTSHANLRLQRRHPGEMNPEPTTVVRISEMKTSRCDLPELDSARFRSRCEHYFDSDPTKLIAGLR